MDCPTTSAFLLLRKLLGIKTLKQTTRTSFFQMSKLNCLRISLMWAGIVDLACFLACMQNPPLVNSPQVLVASIQHCKEKWVWELTLSILRVSCLWVFNLYWSLLMWFLGFIKQNKQTKNKPPKLHRKAYWLGLNLIQVSFCPTCL